MAKVAKLVVYVKATQPQWPSSVVNRADRSIRQKQELTKYRTERSKHMIYLQPCDEHDPQTMVTVPAQIRYFAADLRKNVDMGIAQICFFCRQIVTEPSRGWYTPTPDQIKLLESVYAERSKKQKEKIARRNSPSVDDSDAYSEYGGEDEDDVISNSPVVDVGDPSVPWLDD